MKPTDIAAPDYFHKVVDCQWACPAHTPVPEYIRLIAAGRYSDAYMINWKSNVFPGILGRTCDRPCEPACRRGRVEENAGGDLPPEARRRRLQGRHHAAPAAAVARKTASASRCVGGGPASLTVARDLAPLGYHCTVFDGDPEAGGMMRSQIPKFRLPDSVIDEETGYILDLGVEFNGGTRIDSMKALLAENYDAIFVGSGAPRGRDLDIPGRKEAAANIHIGIDWLSSVSFGHIDKIGKRVIVLGGGNTAMDCCRTARRLGGEDVKVVVRSGFEEMKASPWEKEDAIHEDIPILNFLVPSRLHARQRQAHRRHLREGEGRIRRQGPPQPRAVGRARPDLRCDDVLVAVGQENAFPWIEHDFGIEFDKWDMPKVDREDLRLDQSESVLRRRRRVRPEEHHLGGGARPRRRAVDPQDAVGRGHHRTAAAGGAHSSQKMGIHEWSYDNDISIDQRFKVPHRDKVIALKDIRTEVELGFDVKLALDEAQRCLNCDVQTVFSTTLCIECDACVDICPMDCITFTENGEEADLRQRLKAPAPHPDQDLYVSPDLKTGRVMVKDEDVCLHCGLCAERCPTGAWDMRKYFDRNDSKRSSMPTSRSAALTTSSSSSPTSTARARPAPTSCSRAPSCAWACRSARATSSPRTSRACRPGTRCGSTEEAISAAAAAST